MACVGGGSNSIGAFYPFVPDDQVALYGVEAGGLGLASGKHAATLCAGKEGVFHGMLTYIFKTKMARSSLHTASQQDWIIQA